MTISSPPLKATLLKLLQKPVSIKPFNQLHSLLLISGIAKDLQVAVKIAEILAAFNRPSSAYKTLGQVHHHTTPFLFNSLLSAFAVGKNPRSAIAVYKHMVGDGIAPDRYTFPIILKSCARFAGAGEARQAHVAASKMGFGCDIFVQNALVHTYSVCGQVLDARQLFDEMPLRDVVTWTGLISGYVKGRLFCEALALFGLMDVEPNNATLVSLLVACGRLGELSVGKKIHGLILKRYTEMSAVVGNAVLDMYVKCECLEEAKRMFGELPERDIVSWTCIVSGLVQCKQPKDAIEVFHAMQASGVEPDKVVLSSVLSACGSLGALDSGRWIHEYIERRGVEQDVHTGTAMVDMYAKCGCLEMAVNTFHRMPHKNIFSWNALLGGLAMHGKGREAVDYYNQMVRSGINPNEVTFIAMLNACSHLGLVEEGRCLFNSMTKFYNLTPKIEHYGCMVDLLGRAGLCVEAFELIRSMPIRADGLIWGAMLSACKAHGNVELSQQILGHFLELEPCDSGVYVLLSNIYATIDRWGDVKRVRRLMKEKGIKKEPGSSVIEVDGKSHEFLVGKMDHPLKEMIWMVLYTLAKQIQLDGQ